MLNPVPSTPKVTHYRTYEYNKKWFDGRTDISTAIAKTLETGDENSDVTDNI